jgi:hypothetical protein
MHADVPQGAIVQCHRRDDARVALGADGPHLAVRPAAPPPALRRSCLRQTEMICHHTCCHRSASCERPLRSTPGVPREYPVSTRTASRSTRCIERAPTWQGGGQTLGPLGYSRVPTGYSRGTRGVVCVLITAERGSKHGTPMGHLGYPVGYLTVSVGRNTVPSRKGTAAVV